MNYFKIAIKLFVSIYLMFSSGLAFSKELPVEAFFKYSDISSLQLSPTGEYIAAKTRIKDKMTLVVMKTKTKEVIKVFNFGENDSDEVGSYGWLNDERIYVSMSRRVGPLAQPAQTGFMFAANYDGSKPMQLLPQKKRAGGASNPPTGYRIISGLRKDPDHILVTYGMSAVPVAYKINVYRGTHKRMGLSPVRGGSFVADDEGNLRLAMGQDTDSTYKLFGKKVGSDKWELLYKFNEKEGGYFPLGFASDPNFFYMIPNDTDKKNGVFKFDLSKKELTQVLELQGEDQIMGGVYTNDFESPKLIGVTRQPNYTELNFMEPKHKDAQLLRSLHQTFRGKDVEIVSVTRDNETALVATSSEKDAGTYYLLNLKTFKMEFLLSVRSWVDESQMASMEPFEFKARDGKKIKGYLTLPKGKESNLPLVVLVHGGPYGVRDDWGYDPEAQFFANRGYAVIQVNYRGSGGRGNAFQYDAYMQMGAEMQDDLTDATMWAVGTGIANKDKMCIYGASYGGYAALMGVIKEPDLYKCAIGYAGVYDIKEWKGSDTIRWKQGRRFIDEAWGYDNDEFVKERSPAHNVDKIKAGLLIIHGKDDVRVPIDHYYRLTEALDERDYPYESLVKPFEGHGFSEQQNVYEAYRKMEAFLEKYLD